MVDMPGYGTLGKPAPYEELWVDEREWDERSDKLSRDIEDFLYDTSTGMFLSILSNLVNLNSLLGTPLYPELRKGLVELAEKIKKQEELNG